MKCEVVFTQKEIDSIKQDMRERLIKQALAQFDIKQFAREVKNEAVREASQQIAKDIRQFKDFDEIIKRATDSVEDRINNKLHKMLEKGIVVKFNDLLS